jgi:hypothetical protein
MFLVGERLLQHNNQPAFFCPRIGVQEVIVNKKIDSIPSLKVVHTFILLLSILFSQSIKHVTANLEGGAIFGPVVE